MNIHYLLDCMTSAGFSIPDYVHYKTKTAGDTENEEDNTVLDSREKVWFSAMKLACQDLKPLQRQLLWQKIADSAARYGITGDLEKAAGFIESLEREKEGIRTRSDFLKAANWLDRYAETVPQEVRERLAEHLLQQCVKVGHVPSLTETYNWRQWSGRDPLTPDIGKYIEDRLHKLATGNVYTSTQFSRLPLEEIAECLPALLKTASLGMDVLQPDRFGRLASSLPEHEAGVLDAIMASHGETPIHTTAGSALLIDDATLAAL